MFILKNNVCVCVRNLVSFWEKLQLKPTTRTHPTSLHATFFVPMDEAGFEMEAFC